MFKDSNIDNEFSYLVGQNRLAYRPVLLYAYLLAKHPPPQMYFTLHILHGISSSTPGITFSSFDASNYVPVYLEAVLDAILFLVFYCNSKVEYSTTNVLKPLFDDVNFWYHDSSFLDLFLLVSPFGFRAFQQSGLWDYCRHKSFDICMLYFDFSLCIPSISLYLYGVCARCRECVIGVERC